MNKIPCKTLKKKTNNKAIIISILSLAIILAFFSTSILAMHLTGEDILHKLSANGFSIPEVLSATYSSIPRIGEMYQRGFITFFSYTVTFGSDLFFRLIDVLLCFMAIYMCATVIMGKRPKLKLQDSIILLATFIALVCYNSSEIFTMRFSYLHNYIPIIILVSAVLYILLNQKTYSKWILLLDAIVATLCAASNEIAPISFVFISIALLILNAKFDKNKETRNRLLAVLIGLCVGLIYLLGNGSTLSRAGGSYGVAYDYVSYFEIFSSPLHVIVSFIIHIAYNIRHLFAFIILLTLSVVIQCKQKRFKLAKKQAICLVFSVLYIIGVSQIMILDDMESRLLSPAYLGLVIGLGTLLPQFLKNIEKNNKSELYIISAGLLAMSITAVLDISSLRIKESIKYSPVLEAIETSDSGSYCILEAEYGIEKSMLYNFKTYPPFESWTANYGLDINIYNTKVDFSQDCFIK